MVNNSSGVVTVQSSGANTVLAMAAGVHAVFTCIKVTGTDETSWDVAYGNASALSTAIMADVASHLGFYKRSNQDRYSFGFSSNKVDVAITSDFNLSRD